MIFFHFNLDKLGLKKNFSIVFKIVKLLENRILPFIQPSTEESVYKKVSLKSGTLISNVEDIGISIFWIMMKEKDWI